MLTKAEELLAEEQAGFRPGRSTDVQTEVVWTCLPFIRSGQNHLARHSERGRRQGRQRKRLEDNIREWTGLKFAKSQRAVENRGKGRELVVKSQLPWLRNRWRWRSTVVILLLPLSDDNHQVDYYFVAMVHAGYVCVFILHRTLNSSSVV